MYIYIYIHDIHEYQQNMQHACLIYYKRTLRSQKKSAFYDSTSFAPSILVSSSDFHRILTLGSS